jgi:hypothetical protein
MSEPKRIKPRTEPKRWRPDGQRNHLSQVQDKEYKDTRMAMMVYKRLHGYSLSKLANEFNLSEQTITKELLRAKKTNLLRTLEQKILEALVPKAITLYDKALDDGDLFVAKDVFAQAHKVADRESKQEISREGMGLQAWLALRKKPDSQEDLPIDATIEATITQAPEQAVLPEHPDNGAVAETAERLVENLLPKVTQELEFAKLVGAINKARLTVGDAFTIDKDPATGLRIPLESPVQEE